MAKTIKFNLICDKSPVRTIEDLRNNFSIEDVLDYYNNGLLQRWLHVRKYEKELGEVSAITSDKPMEIIKELIQIFDVATDNEKVEECIYMLRYLDKRKEQTACYERNGFKIKSIIDDYENGYHQLVKGILDNPNNAALIKANIEEMVSVYQWIFKLNYRELFFLLEKKSGLAIMCLLMNKNSREYYLPMKQEVEDGRFVLDITLNRDKKEMYDSICRMTKLPAFLDSLGENLRRFAGVTDGYWKDLEPSGKKYMIINMEPGNLVRSAGLSGGDLGRAEVFNEFVILDGIDYKSNSDTNYLLYMEV